MIFGTLAIHFLSLIGRSHLTKRINPRGYLQVCFFSSYFLKYKNQTLLIIGATVVRSE